MVCSRIFLPHQNIFLSSPPTWKSQNMPVMLDYCRAGSTPVEDCGLRDFVKLVGAKLRKTKETQGERRRGGYAILSTLAGQKWAQCGIGWFLLFWCGIQKTQEMDELNHFDKLCLVQYEGYKRQQRHKLGGCLDGLRFFNKLAAGPKQGGAPRESFSWQGNKLLFSKSQFCSWLCFQNSF